MPYIAAEVNKRLGSGGGAVRRTLKLTSPMMQGDDVKELQTALNAKGFSVGVADGIFGKATDVAVKAFQAANKLTADGIVGALTWAAIDHEAPATPEPTPYAPPTTPTPMYRVRKSWDDAITQAGAFKELAGATILADALVGYKVFDENGNAVYDPAVGKPSPGEPSGEPPPEAADAYEWAVARGLFTGDGDGGYDWQGVGNQGRACGGFDAVLRAVIAEYVNR